MKRSLLPMTLPLALAACGSAPSDPAPAKILVVPATAGREAATIAAAVPTVAAPSRQERAPALSVEDSARINTSEMWSEPIGPDSEPVEIE